MGQNNMQGAPIDASMPMAASMADALVVAESVKINSGTSLVAMLSLYAPLGGSGKGVSTLL